jgi:hypothetical protein
MDINEKVTNFINSYGDWRGDRLSLLRFFKSAYLTDSKGVFNSGLDSKEHRSINFAEGDKIDKSAIADLVQQAIKFNSK